LWAAPIISQAQEVSLVGGMNFSSLLKKDDVETVLDEPEEKSLLSVHLGALIKQGFSHLDFYVLN
jgi:hypothetical protein